MASPPAGQDGAATPIPAGTAEAKTKELTVTDTILLKVFIEPSQNECHNNFASCFITPVKRMETIASPSASDITQVELLAQATESKTPFLHAKQQQATNS